MQGAELAELSIFLTVAQLQSFSKAAVERGVAPSAISHAIRKLEQNEHCICLESSILEVMDAIFGMPIVTSAFVSMHKPHVYNGQGTPAISLSMTREQWQKSQR